MLRKGRGNNDDDIIKPFKRRHTARNSVRIVKGEKLS